MSRPFKPHPSKAELGRITPMTIELDKSVSGLGKYAKLASNPIYYYNSLQYRGGAFYRSVLGYEVLWDRRKEEELMLCLDYLLTKHVDDKLYYFEELKVKKPQLTHGVQWLRGIAPKPLSFDLQRPYELREGESLTARINLLDKPYHVDIERANGEVFTIRYPRYKLLRDSFCKLKGNPINEKQRKGNGREAQGRTRASFKVVNGTLQAHPAFSLLRKMYALPKRV